MVSRAQLNVLAQMYIDARTGSYLYAKEIHARTRKALIHKGQIKTFERPHSETLWVKLTTKGTAFLEKHAWDFVYKEARRFEQQGLKIPNHVLALARTHKPENEGTGWMSRYNGRLHRLERRRERRLELAELKSKADADRRYNFEFYDQMHQDTVLVTYDASCWQCHTCDRGWWEGESVGGTPCRHVVAAMVKFCSGVRPQ